MWKGRKQRQDMTEGLLWIKGNNKIIHNDPADVWQTLTKKKKQIAGMHAKEKLMTV